MKLIVLLLALYTLIFYQHYKIERSKVFLPDAKEIYDTERPTQNPGLRYMPVYSNAELLSGGRRAVNTFIVPGSGPKDKFSAFRQSVFQNE